MNCESLGAEVGEGGTIRLGWGVRGTSDKSDLADDGAGGPDPAEDGAGDPAEDGAGGPDALEVKSDPPPVETPATVGT